MGEPRSDAKPVRQQVPGARSHCDHSCGATGYACPFPKSTFYIEVATAFPSEIAIDVRADSDHNQALEGRFAVSDDYLGGFNRAHWQLPNLQSEWK